MSALMIGATLLDTKGKPLSGLEPGMSNPSTLTYKRGGTSRNVAENLARYGVPTRLITAVGNDTIGRWLLEETESAGVELVHTRIIDAAPTGTYIAILDEDGTLSVALDDTRVMEHVTPQLVYQNRALIRDAAIVFIDGSLTADTIETTVRLTRKYDIPLVFDPSSARLAHKFVPHLADVTLAVPNELEVAALTGVDYAGYDPIVSQRAAHHLRQQGVKIGVVTLSDYGLVYATANEGGYIPPAYTEIVDSTGTGDAITAAIMLGLLEDLPISECMRLGAAAGGLTVQTDDTVVPGLSLDMLYDHLHA